ncbi:MAG: UvrABC system protein C [Promethearchaeota archaeon]|nr:MAG: UvrABC system protein C [Candidatus Lokiarchaeota archaeon]
MNDLEYQRKSIPHEPGIYQFKNKADTIIYIGKAKDLKNRVSSYFSSKNITDPYYREKLEDLVQRINSIDIIVTENEKEALILENILIKKHRPRFNVFMRDSKSYPWVMLSYSERFPRVRLMRNPHQYNNNNLFLGPYTDKKEILRILRDLRKIFPYCACKRAVKTRDRPCLNFQLKLCPGPCIGNINEDEYLENIKRIELFLKGETRELLNQVKKKMEIASREQNYEAAAFWRDKLLAIDNATTKQHVLLYEELDKDIVGFSHVDHFVAIVIIHIREGRISNKSPFSLDLQDKIVQKKEILNSILEQYYQDSLHNLPDIIIVPEFYGDFELLKDILRDTKPKIELRQPIEENEKALMRIANKNARVMVKQEIEMQELKQKDNERIQSTLEEIKELLELPSFPTIIEGFDVSNIDGKDATASMVCFLNGKPYKKKYRHYNIKSKSTPDDVGMMKEVIRRRYSKIMEKKETFPDLILLDGGKGQLNAGVEVLTDLGLDIPLISIAKRLEELFLPNKKESIILPKNSPVLKVFQHIRDEAHRFAVNLHKKQRQKRLTRSILEDIDGIGPATRNKLLKQFGSVSEIKKASIDDLKQVVRASLAEKIIKKFSE